MEKSETFTIKKKNMGNPNIRDIPKPSAKTEIGKFRRNLNLNIFTENTVPKKLLELYRWCKSVDKKKIDYLLELKNLSEVLKVSMMPALIDKIQNGESLNKKEIDAMRLLKDVLVDSHKLKFGDRKVIQNIVTIQDIRKQIFSHKKIVKAKVIAHD